MAQHEGAVVGGIGHILQNTFDPAGAREASGGADVGGAADSGQVDCGADGPGVAADGGPGGEMTLAAAEALCAVVLDD